MAANLKPANAPAVQDMFTAPLAATDPEIAEAIRLELGRQRDEIELIASENIVSRAVLEAQGSVLTNKYAEGLPGKRYYGGCQFVDIAETLAIQRVTKLFGCKFANVQPHSGASANAAVFMALMAPGDTFMGLNLAAGGHLTHGSPVNMSGKWFKVVPYGVTRETQTIDLAPYPGAPVGSNPDALSVSPDGRLLYVANAGNNDVAVVDLAAGRVSGLIPTAWYPTSVIATASTLFVTNGKGMGAGPNSGPGHPDPSRAAHTAPDQLRRHPGRGALSL